MALIEKQRYLSDIAASVRKGEIVFDKDDRPVLSVGDNDVYVGSVSYDMDSGELVWGAQTRSGVPVPSPRGPRPLDTLNMASLKSVGATVSRYAGYRARRESNIVNLEAGVRVAAAVRRGQGVSL